MGCPTFWTYKSYRGLVCSISVGNTQFKLTYNTLFGFDNNEFIMSNINPTFQQN